MSTSLNELVADATAQITNYDASHAASLVENKDAVFVDVREEAELVSTGTIPGSTHAPRGMLEFLIDPDSPKHDAFFDQDKEFVFYCLAGPRGALAAKTAQDLGIKRTANLTGGFLAWQEI